MQDIRSTLFDFACCGRHYELRTYGVAEGTTPKDINLEGSSSSHRRSCQSEAARHALHQMKDTAALKLNENMAALAAYVPCAGLELIQSTHSMPHPQVFEEQGIAAIIDLSGFTKLCAELSAGTAPSLSAGTEEAGRTQLGVLWRTVGNVEQQANASEHAQKIVNEAFGALIDVIIAHGGDILRIAGDALIVVFAVEEAMEETVSHGSAETSCACRAALCCLQCIEISRSGQIPMQVHIGMSFGDLRRFHVGGVGTWQVVVAGEPMREAGLALDQSSKLEVVVTDAVWAFLNGRLDFEVAPVGEHSKLWLLTEGRIARPSWVLRPLVPQERRRSGPLLHSATSWTMRRKLLQTSEMSDITKRALKVYVPELVLQGTITGVSGALAEIRRLTCVFIEIGLDLTERSAEETLDLLHGIFQTIQIYAVLEYGGSIKELTCDDKGLVCIICFGFLQQAAPPQATDDAPEIEHRTSAASACFAAAHIEREMEMKHHTACYIGIASGMVYCAALGNDLRKELAMVSSTMNTAARLMSLVKKGKVVDMDRCAEAAASEINRRSERLKSHSRDVREHRKSMMSGRASVASVGIPTFSERVLCTEEVRHDAGNTPGVSFHELEKVALKGYAEPVSVLMMGVVIKSEDEESRAALMQQFVDDEEVQSPLPENLQPTAMRGSRHLVGNDDCDPMTDVDEWRSTYLQQLPPITYAQYCALLPAYFGARDVQIAAADFVWIRSSGGSPTRIAELVRHFTSGGLGKPDEDDDTWYFSRSEFPEMLDLASQVPLKISQQLLTGVSRLSPLNQLIMKVIAVLGGSGPTKLLRHLLESVHMVCSQWNELCIAFLQKYNAVVTGKSENSNVDILMVVLEDLRDHGILEIAGNGDLVECKDFLLIDTIYSNLTFSHRKILHEAAAAWFRVASGALEEVVAYLPNNIHHLVMSQQESKASARLALVYKLGSGKFNYLEHYMVKQVQWHFPVHFHGESTEGSTAVLRAQQALPAIPSLRGLSKAMEEYRVGGAVSKSVMEFKKLLGRSKSTLSAACGDSP